MRILTDKKNFKVATVAYLNAIPFIYGIENSTVPGLFNLQLTNPNKCYQLLANNEADIALVPVGALPQLENITVIKPFCIGSYSKVDTVLLLSNTWLENIEIIYKDEHSITSNKLAEILIKEHWKISPIMLSRNSKPNQKLRNGEAMITIGDKSFKLANEFKYVFDLAYEWKNMTGNPFVFAVWATKQNLHPAIINDFNKALSIGVDNIQNTVSYIKPDLLPVHRTMDYLANKIKYRLDEHLLKSMHEFLGRIMPDCERKIKFI